jgi:transcriptional regulator with XRE-family HTH domain
MRTCLLETTAMRRVRSEFGEAVKRVLEEHGLSLRGARIRTGIDHVTLSDMASGYVPRMEKTIQFARGFELDVNEWLELAGYDPIRDERPAETRFRDAAREMLYEANQGDRKAAAADAEAAGEDEALIEDLTRQIREARRRLAQ